MPLKMYGDIPEYVPFFDVHKWQSIGKPEIEAYAQMQLAQQQQGFKRQQFERLSPYLEQLQSLLGAGPSRGYNQNDPALLAMTGSIEQRGEEAQRSIASEMARRGMFRGGPSVAASALQRGETEARVAQTKGEFAQSFAERQQREWQAKLNALMQLLGGLQ